MGIKTKTKRRKNNLEGVRECQRQDFKKYKQANPEKVQLTYKRNRAHPQNTRDNLQKRIKVEDKSQNYNKEQEKVTRI